MSNDDLATSLKNMKKVIPLMGKYRIPTTPEHYAVWYTYVSKTNSELNKNLDSILENDAICSPTTSSELYENYIANDNQRNTNKLKKSLEAMILELTNTVDDTINDTSKFDNILNKNFNQLENYNENSLSIDDIMLLVNNIVTNSKNIKRSTKLFTEKLVKAQSEITRLKQELAKVKDDSTRDGLTQLLNRKSFDSELNQLINNGVNFALIMVDIDHFKVINDTYGHVIGDQALKGISKVLKDRIQNIGHVYRYGGEEISILLPNKSLSIAIKIADVCRTNIEKITIRDQKNNTSLKCVTASFGVATFNNGETAEQIIKKADSQLYQAKKLGRNRVMPMVGFS
ncbi:MAG: GGDEF domain-containing protein [Succinivibrionaceae bacterium]